MKNKIILTLIFILLIGNSAIAASTFYFGGKKQTLSSSTNEVQAGYYDHQFLPGIAAENIKAGVTMFGIIGTYGAGGMLPPTLTTTTEVRDITGTTATSGGNISTDGGSPVTARGVCWNTTGSPTTAESKTSDNTGTGIFTSNLTGLTLGITYYVRAYATNSIGTAYGSEVSFTTSQPVIAIGSSYGGGIIFYVDGSGLHGLIAAPGDQSAGIQWCNGSYGSFVTTNATADGVGAGWANTNTIVSVQGTTFSYAARICDELVLNDHDDWYLPSRYELYLLYQNRAAIGGFQENGSYWSSTEYTDNSQHSWARYFTTGMEGEDHDSEYYDAKSLTDCVRAVRAF